MTIAGATLLYLLVDFILNCLAERQDVEASIIGIEKEKDFYHYPIFTGSITAFSHFEEEKNTVELQIQANHEPECKDASLINTADLEQWFGGQDGMSTILNSLQMFEQN